MREPKLERSRSSFRAIVSYVDTHQLNVEFCGRNSGEDFIRKLPDGFDPCGREWGITILHL